MMIDAWVIQRRFFNVIGYVVLNSGVKNFSCTDILLCVFNLKIQLLIFERRTTYKDFAH
jgi:hypothetical protein